MKRDPAKPSSVTEKVMPPLREDWPAHPRETELASPGAPLLSSLVKTQPRQTELASEVSLPTSRSFAPAQPAQTELAATILLTPTRQSDSNSPTLGLSQTSPSSQKPSDSQKPSNSQKLPDSAKLSDSQNLNDSRKLTDSPNFGASQQPSDSAKAANSPQPANSQNLGDMAISRLETIRASLKIEAEEAPTTPADADSSALSADADDEQLEAFLERHMQRLTRKSQEPSQPASHAAPRAEPTAPRKSQEFSRPLPPSLPPPMAEKQPAVSIPAEAPAPSPPAPLQKSQAPEDRDQIFAMRELANVSARQALETSALGDLGGKTHATFLAATALAFLSSILVVCFFMTRSGAVVVGAGLIFALAVIVAFRFFALCRKLTKQELSGAVSN